MSKAIRVQAGDYVDALFNNKRITAKVKSVDNKTIHAVNEKDREHQSEVVLLSLSDVLANYGPDPHHQATEVYRFSKAHPFWGDVHFFRRKDDAEVEALKLGLKKVGRILEKSGLTGFLPIELHIRPPKGKYAGSYKFRPSKNEEVVDIMTLRFPDTKTLPYVILHESGHGVWFRLLSRDLQAKWMNTYHSYLNLTEITESDLEDVRSNFFENPVPLKEYARSLEEPFDNVFKKAIEWIVDNHDISQRNLEVLIKNGSDDSIELLNSMWPTFKMLMSAHEVVISEYATKSVEEFFAEAFAFSLMGTSLPKRVQKLLDRTLQTVANSHTE